MGVKIRRDNDPFKRYWWVILLVFGVAGGWVCLPALQAPPAAAGLSGGEAALGGSGEDSLDAVANPQGAPGGALNLSMDGLGAYRRKRGESSLVSSLYQAPAEAAASTAPVQGAASTVKSDLAAALKFVAKKSASPDTSGWGGEKAQKGWNAPKVNFGSLSGLGSGGSGSAASLAAGPAGGGTVSSGFGLAGPKTGLASARGLKDDGSDGGSGASMQALQSARKQAVAAARTESLSAAVSMGGTSFDGGAGGGGSIGGGEAQGQGGAGVIESLDRSPINLKANDPNLSQKDIQTAPVPQAAPVVDKEAQRREMIKMMIIMLLVGGLVSAVAGGAAGGMVGQMAGPMMQSQMGSSSTNTGSR